MAASNAQPFEINDFSKGMTDDVFNQVPGASEEMVNFLIGSDKKPISRYGSVVESTANPELPSGTRVGGLINYANNDKLFYQSQRQIYYRNPDALTELTGPTGNHAFSEATPGAIPAFTQWNRHLYITSDEFSIPMKAFKDDAGFYQLRSSGLPDLSSTPVATPGAVGANSYLYTFFFSVDYMVFQLSYQTVGPTIGTRIENTAAPDISPITISGIPVLGNGLTQNYDTTNLKIQIYRTSTGGTFSQKVGEVTNGTTVFIDSTSDETLADTGEPLYTNDGTVDFDPPPLHKYNHVVNNTGYYAHLKDEDGNISPYKIRQSVPGVPDTGPLDFETDVDDEIVGISSVNSMPIVGCKKYIFRIDQGFDQFGRGDMDPIRISDHAGLISHNSMVQAEGGLAWLGNDGIYFTDGYEVRKISDHLNTRYHDILRNTTQRGRIIGKYYEVERLIIWTIQTNSSNFENDTLLILDLKWGLSSKMTFFFWQGSSSFRPAAIEIFNNEIYRGDQHGIVLKHQTNLLDDQKVNRSIPATQWTIESIIWKLRSIHYNFGNTFFRKFPTRVLLTAADAGNTTIQITAINDDGKVTRNCKPIRIRRDLIWRDDDFVWRVTDFIWRGAGLIEQWRRFPARSLRLSTLQLLITNGFSDITNSDTLGLATFDNTLNTVTLDSATLKWPLASEDYFIATEFDDYVKEYLVTSRGSDSELTVSDPMDVLPSGSLKWVMRGYKKGEPLNLLSYNIHWTNVSATQETYDSSAAATGENA